MNELSNMPQNWLGEWRRPADVSIYSRISNSHPCESRRDVVAGQSSSGGDPIEFFFSPEISVILRSKRNKTCSNFTMSGVCNDAPSESPSGHIDLFRVRQKPPELPDRSLPAGGYVIPQCPRYHSIQLALITGLFACGGLICSMLLIDGSDDLVPPHYWLRKSYGSPALQTPQKPICTPVIP
jgi:hypothetical protein